MLEEFNQKVNSLVSGTRVRLKVRAEFYARAGLTNLTAVGRRGEEILLKWLEAKSKTLEERAEQAFWQMNRPIGWLNKLVDQFESKTHQSKQAQESRADEKKLEENEVSRMMGEGGCEPLPEEISPPEQKSA